MNVKTCSQFDMSFDFSYALLFALFFFPLIFLVLLVMQTFPISNWSIFTKLLFYYLLHLFTLYLDLTSLVLLQKSFYGFSSLFFFWEEELFNTCMYRKLNNVHLTKFGG